HRGRRRPSGYHPRAGGPGPNPPPAARHDPLQPADGPAAGALRVYRPWRGQWRLRRVFRFDLADELPDADLAADPHQHARDLWDDLLADLQHQPVEPPLLEAALRLGGVVARPVG